MESSARAKRTRSGAKKTGENSEKDGSTTVNTHFPAFDALKGDLRHSTPNMRFPRQSKVVAKSKLSAGKVKCQSVPSGKKSKGSEADTAASPQDTTASTGADSAYFSATDSVTQESLTPRNYPLRQSKTMAVKKLGSGKRKRLSSGVHDKISPANGENPVNGAVGQTSPYFKQDRGLKRRDKIQNDVRTKKSLGGDSIHSSSMSATKGKDLGSTDTDDNLQPSRPLNKRMSSSAIKVGGKFFNGTAKGTVSKPKIPPVVSRAPRVSRSRKSKAGSVAAVAGSSKLSAEETESDQQEASATVKKANMFNNSAHSLISFGESDLSSVGTCASGSRRFPERRARRSPIHKNLFARGSDEDSYAEDEVDDSDADPHFVATSDEDSILSDLAENSPAESEETVDEDETPRRGNKKEKLSRFVGSTVKKSGKPRWIGSGDVSSKRGKSKKSIGGASKKDGFVVNDSDSEEWEAVEELADGGGPSTSGLISITVNLPSGARKKNMDMEKFLLARLNRRQKELRENTHRVHLLCSLGHGFFLNDTIGRNPELLGIALSLWDEPIIRKEKSLLKNLDPLQLQRLVTNLKCHFPVAPESIESPPNTVRGIKRTLLLKRCPSYLHLTLVMLLMLRSLGVQVRLIYSMQPFQVKPARIKNPSAKKPKVKESPFFKKVKGEVSGKKSPKKGRKRKLSSGDEADVSGDEEKGSAKQKGKKVTSRKSSIRMKKLKESTPPAESQLEEQQPSTSAPKSPSKPKSPTKPNIAKVPLPGTGLDYWLDVYCPKSKLYVPIHCVLGEVNRFNECERSATQPVHYVVAFSEPRTAKEATPLFCENWLIVNRKLQVDLPWWKEVLEAYKPKNVVRDKEEDERTLEILMKRPRPKTVQEYKGHPLFVLRRDLLKYEAIYPPNAAVIDEIKGESVYLRETVKLLHTRENWLKEARTVILGEKPYKLAKKIQRKKKSRKRGDDPNAALMDAIAEQERPKDEMVGLYGEWQTENYKNPVAKNGKVPRNEYGNVDMFKPSMLPIGCVHIPIKSMNRVARKLNIDCAAAMTGWDFSGGHCHPVMDGWIVCKEFEETLMDAWNNEQEKIEAEAKAKKSQRAMANWKKLWRGLEWKKRLNLKYGVSADGLTPEKLKKMHQMDVDSDSD